MSRLGAWLLAVPLILCGCEGAHGTLDRLIRIDGPHQRELLERSGLGASLVLPLLALAGAIVLTAVALHLIRGDTVHRRAGVWAFVLPTLVAFSLQEQLEVALAHGHPSARVFLTAKFGVGLMLQALFGLAAFAMGRCLFRVADVLGRLARSASHHAVARAAAASWARVLGGVDASHLLGSADGTRGPPAATLF